MQAQLQTLNADQPFDVVVIGAGGAGLSAALFAALDGARVLIVGLRLPESDPTGPASLL